MDYVAQERFKIYLKDCIFLHQYHYLGFYEKYFSNKNLYKYSENKGPKINILNILMVPGVGGLHSFTEKEIKTSPSPYSGSPLIFSFSNKEHVTFNLDFQSFYVNIVLQLLEILPNFKNEKDLLNELNKIRLELKAKSDPNDIIFKISTLAYTSSLNDYRSNVFFPKLYYSMTLNEQLLCLELLEHLKKHIVKIVEVNTDGVIIFFKRENYDQIITTCDEFEKKYNFKIDTRTEIESGFFFSCNKKIYIDQRNKTIIKGFSTGFSFNYFSNLLFYLLQDHKEFFINFINNEESRKNLYNILWKTFSSQLQDLKKNKTIELFIKNETINKTKMLLFFF